MPQRRASWVTVNMSISTVNPTAIDRSRAKVSFGLLVDLLLLLLLLLLLFLPLPFFLSFPQEIRFLFPSWSKTSVRPSQVGFSQSPVANPQPAVLLFSRAKSGRPQLPHRHAVLRVESGIAYLPQKPGCRSPTGRTPRSLWPLCPSIPASAAVPPTLSQPITGCSLTAASWPRLPAKHFPSTIPPPAKSSPTFRKPKPKT